MCVVLASNFFFVQVQKNEFFSSEKNLIKIEAAATFFPPFCKHVFRICSFIRISGTNQTLRHLGISFCFCKKKQDTFYYRRFIKSFSSSILIHSIGLVYGTLFLVFIFCKIIWGLISEIEYLIQCYASI